MAANRQQGLLQVVARNDHAIKPLTGGFDAPSSGGAQAASASAAAFGSISRTLSSFANQVGAVADHAASVEGAKAGKQAGLDPEFRPRNNGTIRGEAYDRAGLQVFANKMRIQVEQDIDSGGDLAAKRKGWLGQVPEELRPEVEYIFDRAALVANRKAARQAEANVRGEALGSLQDTIDQSVKGLHQRAFSLGLDDTANGVLETDLGLLKTRLAQTGPDGAPLIAPARAAKLFAQAERSVTDARLLGAFDRLPSNQARIAFIEKLEEDFGKSKGIAKNYDLPGFQRITRQLTANLNTHLAQGRQVNAALSNEMKAMKRAAEKGFAPSQDQLAGLRARIEFGAATPEARQQFARLEDLASFQTSLRASRPQQVSAYIDAEQVRMGKEGPDPHSLDRLDLAKTFLGEMRKELERDQLGWANRVEYSEIPDLDFSDQSNVAQSLRQRIAQAEDVARHYHGAAWKQKVQYLKPDERARLAAIASQGGSASLSVAGLIAEHVDPERSKKILGEMFKEAPTAAVLGNLVAKTGQSAIARDIADGIALSKTDFKKVDPPTAVEARTAANSVHKGALNGFAHSEAAVIAATNFAYQLRAQRRGIARFDDGLWKQTFREVLGETTNREGETFGGITVGRSGFFGIGGPGAIVVPPNVKNSGFHDLRKAITLADVNAAYDPSDFADSRPRYVIEGRVGPPVSEQDFRNATLEQFGDGQYWLNLGDSDDPQYLADRNGQPFVLDLNKLEARMREKRSDLYLGGGPRTEVRASTEDLPSSRELRPVPSRVPEPPVPGQEGSAGQPVFGADDVPLNTPKDVRHAFNAIVGELAPSKDLKEKFAAFLPQIAADLNVLPAAEREAKLAEIFNNMRENMAVHRFAQIIAPRGGEVPLSFAGALLNEFETEDAQQRVAALFETKKYQDLLKALGPAVKLEPGFGFQAAARVGFELIRDGLLPTLEPLKPVTPEELNTAVDNTLKDRFGTATLTSSQRDQQKLFQAIEAAARDTFGIVLTVEEVERIALGEEGDTILNNALARRGDFEGRRVILPDTKVKASTQDQPGGRELRPLSPRVPAPNAPTDDRTPAAKNGMISGTAIHMPKLSELEGAIEQIQAYELGRPSTVTGDDYQRMMPLMERVYVSDGMDAEASAELRNIFEQIEKR